MKYLLSLYALIGCVATLLLSGTVSAQSHQLRLQANKNLQPKKVGRYDDVYFTSRERGHLVASSGKIYRTENGGRSWNLKYDANNDTTYFRSIEFLEDGNIGIAGALNGRIFRTADAGEHWSEITTNIADTGVDERRICGLTHHGDTFFGVGWWGSKIARYYKSIDKGITWKVNYIDTTLATSLVDITFLNADTLVAVGGGTYDSKPAAVVLKTTDGGQNWERVFADTIIAGRVWKVQFVEGVGYGSIEPYYDNDTVNIIKTVDNGETWQIIPIGRSSDQTTKYIGTQAVGFINKNRGWVGGYYWGFFETYDGGKTWKYQRSSMANMNRIFRVDDKTIYATYQNGVARNGTQWSSNTGDAQGSPQKENIPSHTLYPIVPNPAKDKIRVDFDISITNNIVLELVDISGKRAYRLLDGQFSAGHYTYQWDTSAQPDGEYLILLGTDEIPLTQKFIIRR